MQLKDDSRAMSNSRPSLIWQGEVLTLNPPPSTEVVGKHARVQYITWEVEHGFVSRCLHSSIWIWFRGGEAALRFRLT